IDIIDVERDRPTSGTSIQQGIRISDIDFRRDQSPKNRPERVILIRKLDPKDVVLDHRKISERKNFTNTISIVYHDSGNCEVDRVHDTQRDDPQIMLLDLL